MGGQLAYKTLVSDFVRNVCDYVFKRLKVSDTAIVFDRYYDFSIKSSTRLDRGKFSDRTHTLILTSPLPIKTITLNSSHNKVQLINLICEQLVSMATSMNESRSLLITGPSPPHIEVKQGIALTRDDIQTTHEEADLIMVQQAYQPVLYYGTKIVSIISDDTDVFAILLHFYWKLNQKTEVLMQSTYNARTLIDIGETVHGNMSIIPSIMTADALSGCDTVAPYHGIGELTIEKKLREEGSCMKLATFWET